MPEPELPAMPEPELPAMPELELPAMPEPELPAMATGSTETSRLPSAVEPVVLGKAQAVSGDAIHYVLDEPVLAQAVTGLAAEPEATLPVSSLDSPGPGSFPVTSTAAEATSLPDTAVGVSGPDAAEPGQAMALVWPSPLQSGIEVTIAFPDGVYRGHIRNGVSHGYGTYLWTSGDSYTGSWRDGALHGFGLYQWADGSSYEGDWKDNARSGRGLLINALGDQYQGTFLDGQFHGTGTYTWSKGDRYEGGWLAGQRSGLGVFYTITGSYAGEWLADRRSGIGLAEWTNGDRYEGHWANDLMDGDGLFRFANGDACEGQWVAGVIHGLGRCSYADGSYYEGRFENGRPSGGWFTDHAGNTMQAMRDASGAWLPAVW
jgi:hypothetical protein